MSFCWEAQAVGGRYYGFDVFRHLIEHDAKRASQLSLGRILQNAADVRGSSKGVGPARSLPPRPLLPTRDSPTTTPPPPSPPLPAKMASYSSLPIFTTLLITPVAVSHSS